MKNSEHDFTLPPFPAFPSVKRYLALGPVLDAVARVSRSIAAREAISLIIGPAGTGKSLACALLAKQFESTHDVVAIGETTISDEPSLYRGVLHRLGVPFDACGRDELERLVQKRLCGNEAKPNGAVVIIDEAASLSADVLESIRRLTNLMVNEQPMVSVVIAGGVKLDETLTAPSLEGFVQRVAARCYLHPLSLDEVRGYIRGAIEACEASPEETITDNAMSAIYHATNGVPRLVNQLMTEAIDCAAELERTLIDESIIERAWASLQQLPSPMIEEPMLKAESSIVEFGELLDPLPMDAGRTVCDDPVAKLRSEMVAESLSRAEQEAEGEAFESCDQDSKSLAPLVEPAADPVKLFGEFDDEEQIEVISGGAGCSRGLCDTDLESMIHSQIVGLSHFAADNTESRRDEAVKETPMESSDTFQYSSEDVSDFVSDLEAEREPDQAPSVLWYDEPDVEADAAAVSDDTDLLWITEDIDVEQRLNNGSGAPSTLHRIDGPDEGDAPRLSIDYREMLDKMRNQSSL